MVRTIGLIGGMSWESTALYYQTINRAVQQRLGGLHSARIHLLSLDFQEIADQQKADDWDGMARVLQEAARKLESTGADCVLIGTNTMHKLAPQVQAAIQVPLLHIADVTADAIHQQGLRCVGLLGTRFTMEQPFYLERLASHGIECVVPGPEERDEVHRIIFEELCRGQITQSSRRALLECIASLQAHGAQGAVLGCTELPLLVSQQDSPVPLFNTTELHALAAVEFALR